MKNRAFTLIEVVISVSVVSILLTAVYGLIITTINTNQRNLHTFQATMLANEGLEVVRYMRDSNWLQNYSWNKGLEAGTINLSEIDRSPFWETSVQAEVIDIYTREIELKEVENYGGVVEVIARVTWDESGKERDITLSTYLSDWQ